jgi:3-dehydroquinate synthase
LRAILNYGHTIGHAVETVTGYKKFLHGEAVAIGMAFAADMSVKMGMLKKGDAKKIRNLIETYELPNAIPDDINVKELADAIEIDKKVNAGKLKFILSESIGNVKIEEDIDRKMIKEMLS